MRLLFAPAKTALVRSLGVVVLCYALLAQAALATVLRAQADMPATGAMAYVLCLTDHADLDEEPGQPAPGHHDVGCCIAASRPGLNVPAMVPVAPAQLPAPASRLFRTIAAPSSQRAPPSIDLETRAARAPPILLG